MAIKSNKTESVEGREQEISTHDLRTRMDEIFNQVVYDHHTFIVKRKGEEVAAIIPMERIEELRKLRREEARQELIKMLDQQKGMGSDRSDEEVMEEACKLVEEVRRAKLNQKES